MSIVAAGPKPAIAVQVPAPIVQWTRAEALKIVQLGLIGNCFLSCREVQCKGDYCDGVYHDCNLCLANVICVVTCIRPLHNLICCPFSCCIGALEGRHHLNLAKATLLSGPAQQSMS